MSIKAVQEELGLDYKDARNQFGNLRVKNAIECVGRKIGRASCRERV